MSSIKRLVAWPVLLLFDVLIWACGCGKWRELRRASKPMDSQAEQEGGSCEECPKKDECATTKAEECPWLIHVNKCAKPLDAVKAGEGGR